MLCSFSLQLIFFFRTAILQKLFDIRFSYKHCNFSNVCLLIKMAYKTVTRSTLEEAIFLWVFTIILYIDLLFHGHFLNFMLRCLMLFYLPYITVSRLCHLSKPRKWVLRISRDGDNQRIFRVLKF